ncbi:MAG: hypothetical protein AVDCRST_MAG93-4318, partial [uncultured Chloroflexia bacterium]
RGTVYLLLDHSTSMSDKGKMEGLVRGSLRLFVEARKREYTVGAIGFADRAHLLLRPSCDVEHFGSRLATLEPIGRTAMAQALHLATRQLRRRRGDKIILLVTDGMPDSREAALDAARLARTQGVTIIAIGIGRADEVFLAALTPKPELASKVELKQPYLSITRANSNNILPCLPLLLPHALPKADRTLSTPNSILE